MKTIVVTRHSGLVDYLKLKGVVDEKVQVLATVTSDEVADSLVIGVLPFDLALRTAAYVSVIFRTPPRGAELTAEDMERAGVELVGYIMVPFCSNCGLMASRHFHGKCPNGGEFGRSSSVVVYRYELDDMAKFMEILRGLRADLFDDGFDDGGEI